MDLTSLLIHNRGWPMFLPAHSRGCALPKDLKKILSKRAGIWDLPELPDIGSPLDNDGAISESQKESANLFGADRAWYGVNGASGLLQAGLFSMLRPGQAVLMPRNVHRSLIHACILGDFTPVLFDVPYLPDRGHSFPPNKIWLKEVLNTLEIKGLKVSGAVLVNPTYHGYSSDISALVNMMHDFNLPVLVDEAHGTHFAYGLDKSLPRSALIAGADLVVHSLHKSSLGLSQTAVLWSKGELIDPDAVRRSIECFQTSSPNALLLSSCETALREWTRPSGENNFLLRIREARDLTIKLRNNGMPLLENQDPLKLILHTGLFGISGFEADTWFMSQGITAELPEPSCLTFCLGFAPNKGFERVFQIKWNQLLHLFRDKKPFDPHIPPPLPFVSMPEMNCSSAWRAPSQSVDLNESLGKISADLICPYPPGIPLIIPGEQLEQARLDWLNKQRDLWPKQIPSKMRVVS